MSELFTFEGFKKSDLCHHGIKGQKWGEKNGPPYPLNKNNNGGLNRYKIKNLTEKDNVYNLSKFGQDKEHNVLYITGLSGSGKSTLSYELSKKTNSDIISLDFYYENPNEYRYSISKGFNEYVERKVPEYKQIVKNFEEYDKIRFSGNDKAKYYWETMDKVFFMYKTIF